jgi:rhamnose utilization protein RhaD (predicted bifunctional aldolase and dehydrogenase)/NAD(P)-dependent dehydrogenase (short-subunit alcohol dehydrogenase family)
MLHYSVSLPSIETLMHAFINHPCLVHTHPNAILCLTNRDAGECECTKALGETVGVIPYANAGLDLARAAVEAVETTTGCEAIVVMHHGLITWGATPQQAYASTIDIVNRAERYIAASRSHAITGAATTSVEQARKRYITVAPIIRKMLSPQRADPDKPFEKMLLAPLITEKSLGILSTSQGRDIARTAPLTPDYLVRTKTVPLILSEPDFEKMDTFQADAAQAIEKFSASYDAYMRKFSSRLPEFDISSVDPLPRVVMLPGVGAICAGPDIENAAICRAITEQALSVKQSIHETGGRCQGLTEDHLFDMEFRAIQRAKVGTKGSNSLVGSVAIVTGAAGAIGSGICEGLLRQGCAVVVTDLPGKHLEESVARLKDTISEPTGPGTPSRVLGIALDVTDPASVSHAFDEAIAAFGGIDIVIINAGLAHVSPLTGMDIESFKRLERVNVEGTLNCLAEAGRRFKLQGMGGDIVLISTKNVFSPGAGFGAYSATKAASHQLCRIASLEFAEMDVRVNMVSPDAVFSHGSTKSGLWAEVGPGRMKARGLDEKGLEEYYRNRNLLKTAVTAAHVAKAVLFFVTRQTPTTGATIPVDGGLPDATPR